MFKTARILYIYTETQLHAGSGSSLGPIDLPIQRERHTQFPTHYATGIKGALRDLVENLGGLPQIKRQQRELEKKLKPLSDEQNPTQEQTAEREGLKAELKQKEKEYREALPPIEAIFGPDTDRASDHAGAMAPTDARLLLFPVRSLDGIFRWITCPTALFRLRKDFGAAFPQDLLPPDLLNKPSLETVLVSTTGIARVVLEDFAFNADTSLADKVAALGAWIAGRLWPEAPAPEPGAVAAPDAYSYCRDQLKKSLVVVHDEVFRDFVVFGTEVVTRNSIGETGTVADTALWTEELLPSDSLLYSRLLAQDPRKPDEVPEVKDASAVINYLGDRIREAEYVQFGGDETVGRGLVYLCLDHLEVAP